MDVAGLTLIVPEKIDPERRQVIEAWQARGGTLLQLGRFWEPPAIDRTVVRIYGNSTFAWVLAQKFDLTLVSPDDALLASLPNELLGREVGVLALDTALKLAFPRFAKPVVPKQFRAAVYATSAALAAECRSLPGDTPVLASDVVAFTAEARAFVCDGVVLDLAIYEGGGDASAAHGLVQSILSVEGLPRAYVVDVGRLADGRWVTIEFNAAWGAGLNGCRAERVIDAIAGATRA